MPVATRPRYAKEGSATPPRSCGVGAADEDALRGGANDLPIIAVRTPSTSPYVLDTDLVQVPASRVPLDEIARTLARRLGDAAAPLAGRLPVLRDAVVDELIPWHKA